MSDDLTTESSRDANVGTTLPSSVHASHNIGLSPLFNVRLGNISTANHDLVLNVRGQHGYMWSSNTLNQEQAYFLIFHHTDVMPSYYSVDADAFSWPLRCLVSTNNR